MWLRNMTVYITDDGYLQSPIFPYEDCKVPIEITDEQWETLSSTTLYHNWKYTNGTWEQVLIDEMGWLRHRRQRDCFDYLDSHSKLWYNTLTDEQTSELQKWYQDWLDVTTTKLCRRSQADWSSDFYDEIKYNNLEVRKNYATLRKK